ncbi:hypothetical protein AVEN_152386-1 [Araneus ventricosus]|uniref:RNA-directed DNA polymerase n=1 Tax=Araneus ventricosus TaxID=182803 RepID=A0A4Y2DB67_ARAVE|nr:hypothetical protein AVEN_152386-1 [Araneus ventricosus]
MPFRLCNVSATFERPMETVLRGLSSEAYLVYLDDIMISSCEIQKAQLEDPAIKPILEKELNSAYRPSWEEIAQESPVTKRYWAVWDSLHLKDGVLYRKWESDGGSSCRWQLILLKSRIPEVLRETHDSASGRHFGVMKILSKTRERFYWDRLRADVEKWCRECDACGTRKRPKTRTKCRLHHYNVGAPFERMALDILGHSPEAEDEVTGLTPAKMLFSRTLRLPCDILFGRPRETPSSPNEYIKNLDAHFESVHAFAIERIKLASELMKTRYDSRVTDHHFKEGDIVRMYDLMPRRGLSSKLQQNWEGPYTVVKKLNDVVYRVQRSPNAKSKVIHINQLAPYQATDYSADFEEGSSVTKV